VKRLWVVAGVLFLALAGCRRHPRRDRPYEEVKVEEWQKSQAVDAAERLRAVFNASACQPIYDAADAYFRKNQSSFEWDTECELLKKQLGSWQSFQVTHTQRCATPLVVCVGGAAKFEKGDKQIDLAWLLTPQGPQLFWIAMQQDEQHWKQIPPMPFLYRLMDPMPVRFVKNG
jgi:hypothetical protein